MRLQTGVVIPNSAFGLHCTASCDTGCGGGLRCPARAPNHTTNTHPRSVSQIADAPFIARPFVPLSRSSPSLNPAHTGTMRLHGNRSFPHQPANTTAPAGLPWEEKGPRAALDSLAGFACLTHGSTAGLDRVQLPYPVATHTTGWPSVHVVHRGGSRMRAEAGP